VADGHGRRAGSRGVPDTRRPDEQLDLRAPRSLGAAAAERLTVREGSIWTSALAIAGSLRDQRPGGSAFVIGESGLTTALHQAGYTLSAPSFMGKPNRLMIRSALNATDAHSENTAMIGDRVGTDIVAGLETILVLTAVTTREDTERHPYRPSRIVDSVAELIDELG
jgi:ribonucleotide monophosphatase NagD (HAD superfamily)